MENYTNIWYRLHKIKKEIEDIDDHYLMEEIMYLDYDSCEKVSKIVHKYVQSDQITFDERVKLENFYILVWIDEDTEE